MYLKGRTVQAKQLAESIEFKPAKTLEEAIEFGKKNLGIKSYDGFKATDVDGLNWINEGLTNISNKMKGKLVTPETIKVTKDSDYRMAVSNNKKVFFVPEETLQPDVGIMKCINNIDNFSVILHGTKNNAQLTPSQIFENYDKLTSKIKAYENGKIKSFGDKTNLYYDLDEVSRSILGICERPDKLLKKYCLNNDSIVKAAKQKGLLTDIKEIEKMQVCDQRKLLFDYVKEFNIKFELEPRTKFNTIYHEFGHLQDMNPKTGGRANYHFDYDKSKYPQFLKDWFNDKQTIKTASEVSHYATSGPGEFIAETFAGLMDGRKFSQEVLELYKKHNGPAVPGVTI